MKILIYDIETYKEMFLIDILIEEKHIKFAINKNVNDLYNFIKFVESHQHYYWVGYNNLRFDAQVIEYIIRKHEHWYDESWEEICNKIHQKGSDIIDDLNYDILPTYSEEQLTLPQIDLFLIHHFDNKNRMVSLKRLEFEMDMENIEELPVPIKKNLDDKDIALIEKYCKNDVDATHLFYLYTIGEVDHKLYKGKNKITDREIVEQETGMKCLNWSDVKIGAEWNKLDYLKLTRKREKDIYPKKVNYFYGKKYRQFFPSTVKFKTERLKRFIGAIGNTFILNKKQVFTYKFNDVLSVNVGRGGLHSKEQPRIIVPKYNEIYIQNDLGSQYPNALRKYRIFPQHLGIEWNNMLTDKIVRRLEYKKLFTETKEPKYDSLQKMGKDSLNGGAYGRLNTRGDWQEDPCAMLKVTMGCQLEILMIVEALILNNFNVVSVNTKNLVL